MTNSHHHHRHHHRHHYHRHHHHHDYPANINICAILSNYIYKIRINLNTFSSKTKVIYTGLYASYIKTSPGLWACCQYVVDKCISRFEYIWYRPKYSSRVSQWYYDSFPCITHLTVDSSLSRLASFTNAPSAPFCHPTQISMSKISKEMCFLCYKLCVKLIN